MKIDKNKDEMCREILEMCKKMNISLSELSSFEYKENHSFDKNESCNAHNMVKVGESVYCLICGDDFGWWCENSPTHACNYEQKDGSYNEDNCIYCHDPEERK